MVEPKKRKVTRTDWDKVEKYVSNELEARKTSKFRKAHEVIWKEVDRQIKMEPMQKKGTNGQVIKSWHSALELGDLSTASEILTSDVMRIIFSNQWFKPHVELDFPLNPETGKPSADNDKQKIADGLLRSLMIQQHKDFGLKARFRLSVKESLHHGSFVAEARFDREMMVKDGDRVKTLGAPVWVPYSMWNAYPDPSPSIVGTNTFYTGSMILVEYLPMWKFKKRANGDGWIQERVKKVERRGNRVGDEETEDVELVKFKGDLSIERSDGDIFLPNSEVILANGKLVYYAPNELPYPNVIFSGYERQDVRDPYYTSPIIKLSPTHKITTIVANKFLDATALKVEPPVEYDSNDPDYAANDGPDLSPGSKSGTRSMGQGFKTLDIGDPRFALDAYTLGMQQLKEGLGVSSNRAGVRDQDRETATSANLANQGAEVRTIEFVSQLEPQGLLPFLYMQHELNRMHMKEYSFYNDEMNTPDFIRATNKDIQANAHFEIVGSKGLLGEEQRRTRVAQSVAFFSGNPLFAGKLNAEAIMLDELRDAGKKNPEEWVKVGDKGPQIPPQVQQQMQEMQKALQQLSQENQQLKSGLQVKILEIKSRQAEAQAKNALKAADLKVKEAIAQKSEQSDRAEMLANIKQQQDELTLERQNADRQFALEFEKLRRETALGFAQLAKSKETPVNE